MIKELNMNFKKFLEESKSYNQNYLQKAIKKSKDGAIMVHVNRLFSINGSNMLDDKSIFICNDESGEEFEFKYSQVEKIEVI
jgi:hypothetical protein